MANSGNFCVPSDFSPSVKPEPTSPPPTSLPISQICQINLASLIKPSVSSAFSIVPSSSSSSSSSSTVAAAKRRYSDAEIVLLRLITGREATTTTAEEEEEVEEPLAESESESDGSGLGQSEISLEDRLKKTTSIWFLPESTRTGVTHLLQGKEPGCFIVRNSSKPKSMALSVRLPEGKGPHVEHYLIESHDVLLHLEGSENYFACITTLIAHYCGCCDELPARLTLPQKLMEANSVKLISYSLLGQDFWHSISKPAPQSIGSTTSSLNNSSFISLTSTNKPTTLGSNRTVSQATINTTTATNSNKALHHDYHSHQVQHQGQKQQQINQICLSSTSTASSSCSPPLTSSSASCLLSNDDQDLLGLIEDPLVDVRKSSTVPINIVKSDFAVKPSISPKPPPRSAGTVQTSSSSVVVPPPVPSRTSKPLPKTVADSTSKSSSNNSIISCTICFSSEEEDSSKFQPFEAQEEIMLDNYVNNNMQPQPISQKTFENRDINEISSHHDEDLSQVKLRGEKSPKSIDTLIKYYNSRVEDKYSDYEDIWSFAPKTSDEQEKTQALVDIEPSEEPPSSSLLKDVEATNAAASASCSISTQTDSMEPTSSETSADGDACRGSDLICRNEHYSHYGSDSNLTMSSCRSSRSRHNLSLESLLNLNNSSSIYNDSADDGFCRNMFNKLNPQLEDVSIQVGDGRTTASSSKPRHRNCAHRRAHHHRRRDNNGTKTSKDSSWLLDSSWKWQRSNEAIDQINDSTLNTDTDDTTLTLRSPLRRNKRPNSKSDDKRILDQERADLNRYRRFSARYVLESGVESDPENSTDCDNKERKSRTVEDLIALEAPELKVSKIDAEPEQNSNTHNDSYDNVVTLRKHDRDSSSRKANREDSSKTSGGTLTDTETVFCEPWDSEYWRKLISVTPGKTELMMSLSPDEEEGVSTSLEAGCSSSSTAPDEGRVKREDSSKSKIANLSTAAASFSYNGNRSSQSGDEANPLISERESLDITEVTSFASDATSDILSSISMQEQTRISMTSDSSTLIGYKSESTGNERIYSVGKNICDYIFKLAEENDNTFAKSVSHFIDCTKDLHETNPHVVMRNMRQFMNGMKNYLVKHGEKNFLVMVKEERNKLKKVEFLNIDAIIEGTLHRLVIKPLKAHLDQLFVEYYKKNGSLQLLSENMKAAQKKGPQELGVRYDLHLPDSKSMAIIQKFFERMQRAYSPLKKLEHLLAAISAIYSGVKSSHHHHQQAAAAASSGLFYPNKGKLEHLSIGADDLLPIFIYVLVHCGLLSAEIEAEYMWGLLHPSLLSGEGGYYLTTLSSCLHVLKNMTTVENESSSILNPDDSNATSATILNSSVSSSPQSTSPPATPSITGTGTSSSVAISITPSKLAALSDNQGYMKIMIPNELSCSIVTKTLPVRPNMTTKDVCKMIAHKFNQTNSEDYGLFQVTADGDEIQLEPVDLPQTIRSEKLMAGQAISFAYKRIDAKFIWPRMDDQ